MKRNFENWIQAYLQFTEASEAPATFHFWTAISTIAGALRRRVWIDEGEFQWTPNFYIVFVAPPGVATKTTTMNAGMKLLRQIEGVRFGPNIVTWQALVTSLADAGEEMVLDGTFYPMSPVTIASGEFGNLLNPRDREMIDLMVSLWDGQIGILEKTTKTSGNDTIVNPWVNLIACTTPDWIAGNFPEYMIGGGFTSRTIFIYEDTKRRLVPYPHLETKVNRSDMEARLVEDLQHIVNNVKGEMYLSDDALEFGKAWYTELWTKAQNKHLGERFQSYFVRKQTHLHKLAIVLSAAASDSLQIERWALEHADIILREIEANMSKVFQFIGTDDARNSNKVVNIVDRYGEIDISACYQLLFQQVSFADFRKAVEGAIQAGYITQVLKNGKYFLTKRG